MALFTMIMGNAFAAFPVMTAAIGLPILIKGYGGDPAIVGREMKLDGSLWTVIGVVKDVKHRQSLSRDYEPEYYVPHAQIPFNWMSLIMRTTNDARSLARSIQQEVRALDRDVPVYRIKTLDQYLGV